ncbi:hypothetical protein [Streptomyces collinus]|uniref:hypothetical protein n=1 Tax=Streptomyces collinus TaxID=42684 RepID=UPI0033FDBBDB
MTPRIKLIVVVLGLVVFTGLALSLLALGQPVTVVGPLIVAIVWGVQQLVQALDAVNRRDGAAPRRPAQLPPGGHSDDVAPQTPECDDEDEDERPAA